MNELFFSFLRETATAADALYILGDLFEYWIGDDDMETGMNAEVVAALRGLTDSGTPVFFMHGNRDFLIGDAFARAARLSLLPDPILIELHGQRVLLMHGDTLCTDDVEYQRFRKLVRDPAWQSDFLARPLDQRRREVEDMRRRSEASKREKSMAIMDVSPDAVAETLRIFAYPPLLIHGHTHRPARHQIAIDGHQCERIVLADWHDTGQSLCLSTQGLQAKNHPAHTQGTSV